MCVPVRLGISFWVRATNTYKLRERTVLFGCDLVKLYTKEFIFPYCRIRTIKIGMFMYYMENR